MTVTTVNLNKIEKGSFKKLISWADLVQMFILCLKGTHKKEF